MRLLKCLAGQDFEYAKDSDEEDIPQYAILFHTWGADEEDMIYKDSVDGTGKHKSGYKKFVPCGEQAWRDGHNHFGVDTCCIDKSNGVELNTAITSMFRWYAKASKYYVYLSDVSSIPFKTGGPWNGTFVTSQEYQLHRRAFLMAT